MGKNLRQDLTAEFLEFLSFVNRPTSEGSGDNKVPYEKKILFVFLLTCATFAPTFLNNLLTEGFHFPSLQKITTEFNSIPEIATIPLAIAIPLFLLGALLTIAILALPEEMAFRLPLKIRKWPIIIGFTLSASFLLEAIYALTGGGVSVWAVVVFLLPLLLFIGLGLSYRHIGPKLEVVLTKYFNLYTWVLVLAFAFIHSANPVDGVSELRFETIFYAVLLIPSGLAFSYLRLRFGFWWGLLSHGLTNVFAISMIILLLD